MNRFGVTLLCVLPVLVRSAAAEDMMVEPGQWKVTSKTVMNGGAMPPADKTRCLSPEQTSDLNKTFGPTVGTMNSTCAPPEFEKSGTRLKWHLQCKGQLDFDVSGNFNFDRQTHYTATVSSKGWMAGALISDVKTELEGERLGDCPQGQGG
jgi:hypothetical protein